MSSASRTQSRYSSFDSQSSADLKPRPASVKSLRKTTPTQGSGSGSGSGFGNAVVRVGTQQKLGCMVKKFMEKRCHSKSNLPLPLVIPPDLDSATKPKVKGKASSALASLFGKDNTNKAKALPKPLTEVKSNTRTLAMVLRSERELLALTKDQHSQIANLTSLLNHRNLQVDKLKDLCLEQREEIKSLKTALLFPHHINSQPTLTLETQISSLTSQLHTLSHHLQQVNSLTYTGTSCIHPNFTTPTFNQHQQEASNFTSLDFSSDDHPTTPHTPDDMFLKDMNPCLTPSYSNFKSKEHKDLDYDCANCEETYENEMNPVGRKLSTGSDHFSSLRGSKSSASLPFRKSDESKHRYAKRMVL